MLAREHRIEAAVRGSARDAQATGKRVRVKRLMRGFPRARELWTHLGHLRLTLAGTMVVCQTGL